MKKLYLKPEVYVHCTIIENLMLTASPGISDEEYDPSEEIGSKEGEFEDDEDDLPSLA